MNMARRKTSLSVLARAPEKGRVKTRLGQTYSAEQRLAIYTAMLRDVLEQAASVQDRFDRLSVYWTAKSIPCPPPDLARDFEELDHFLQRGEDLGSRMYNVMADEFHRGTQAVVVIGCDSPHLPRVFLARAADLLQSAEVVLGPSEDGGYYLIGASRLLREPFMGVRWSTSEVLSTTLDILERKKVRVALLPSWYDLDRPEDLRRFWSTPVRTEARHLRQVLEGIFS